ncbi:terminase large subunit domain-containing protein [Microbacterium dauci]|uniref:Terminase large subunit n=1 Tax=Microbacterium dauci TaxID=3048008 RepID=A0ABT6ZAN7_9MICO|nr:terminase large subunit [Microbacterium sp. LX3-4]MDJ1113227.1 terminase large subunit [Microbacterium sp. LX3-4]
MARSRSSQTRPRSAARGRQANPLPLRWPVPKGCGQVYVDKVHERDKATPETAHLFGSAEPRISTPPLRELTPETSLGFEVIDFAYEVLGVVLLPWQRAALIRMLELNEDGTLRFRTAVVLVARQNGKSTLAQVLTIWLLFVWGWPLVLGTAQDLDVAESLWEEVVDLVESNEELNALKDGVTKVNGKKSLNLTTGAKYKVKAANRRAGRGLSGNLVLLDELREHQTWDAWGAITKTTMARAEALILALSNAGDVTSRVLRYLRLMAHRALGDPDGIAALEDGAGPSEDDLEELLDTDEIDLDEFDDEDATDLELDDLEQDEETLCILEWSAPPGCDKRDRTGWSWANPSRGYTISTKTIAAACNTDPEWVFRTEVLCQWNDGATSGPFAPGAWDATKTPVVIDENGRRRLARPDVDKIVGPVVAGLAQQTGRSKTYIALAGFRPDGLPQVEVVTVSHGSDWASGWLTHKDRRGRIRAVGGQTSGVPEGTVLKKLKADPKFRMPVVEMNGSDLLDAYADADDGIREKRVWHTPWASLDLAAGTAEWKTLAGGARVIDVKESPTDPTALRAWIAAYWLLMHQPVKAPPPPPPARVIDLSGDDSDRGDDVDFTSVHF